MMRSQILGLLLMIFVIKSACGFRSQRVIVKGRLMCGDQPAANVQVKLIDEDTGPDPDDEMDNKRTDSNGEFTLDGSTRELSSIDPRFKIYHDCVDTTRPILGSLGRPCQRKWRYNIPKSYINSGKPVNIGTWNLEIKPRGEERDCIH